MENNVQGWNGTHKIFKDLISEIKPKTIVEIGSWKGQSTITMALACKELGLDIKIYAIDTWLGALEFYTHPTEERNLYKKDGYPQVYYIFKENIDKFKVNDIIEPIPLPSNIGIKLIEKADLIYIDGSHEYEDVRVDIDNALQRAGIIFGDDYGNTVFPGVKKAVDETPHNKEIIDNWFWIIRK